MLLSLFKGFSASLGLIVAIGAQNAFVIRQGLLGRHLFLTAMMCATADALLITLGILGFGSILSSWPFLVSMTKYLAMVFLFIYGGLSLRAAFRAKSFSFTNENNHHCIKKTIGILLALTLLNPHAYLDTVILLGSIAMQERQPIYFALGSISASFIWFFAITYGSQLLAPLFCKPISWKIIDITTALIMWTIALTLFFY